MIGLTCPTTPPDKVTPDPRTTRTITETPRKPRPIEALRRTLNVSVPVEIDGKAVDTTDAPILLANSVGGYLPSSVAEATALLGASGDSPFYDSYLKAIGAWPGSPR